MDIDRYIKTIDDKFLKEIEIEGFIRKTKDALKEAEVGNFHVSEDFTIVLNLFLTDMNTKLEKYRKK